LHDILEDTQIPEPTIENMFGRNVLDIVKANSKNMDMERGLRNEDVVRRCANLNESALIVKMADVYDNFLFYTSEEMIQETVRCKEMAQLIKRYKKPTYKHELFDYADVILSSQ